MLDFSNTHYFREFLNEMIDESLEHENDSNHMETIKAFMLLFSI